MQPPILLEAILPTINIWVSTDLIPMTQHMVSTKEGGCSFERWITPALGHHLSKELSINPGRIHYEKRYPNFSGKCDLVIDDLWIEIKHIWNGTQPKQRHALINDIARASDPTNGNLLIFELGLPTWYSNWKASGPHKRTTYIPVNWSGA